ncbi:lipopolysaccharide biosynthesis protein [Heyndrickxia sporothermodurans]|uniref:lipopolysaccharide biosynthesis protein n=1 Tax=Heyndrickxia sporothermodurans TaxID=46224 RepID=UPI002E21CED5|nr:lipopolysaccharide biosynthesis protein [Heyndrickxia sporothermodurans]MED3696924.1 lipopolysaccharide biosynthesis protein [Heyndrickxia sporothermodurans]
MKQAELYNKVLNATKWSAMTEIAAKLVSPITSMVLARVVTPEAFGVVATVTMIVSFADMFTDSGFQKYLVQHEFKSEKDKYKNANVAFWSNFVFSIFLWGLIFIFRQPIATLVGNPGLGNVLAIACLQLPLTSFSSIQMALFRRNFDFKTLFTVRIITILIPIVITIPLAFAGLNYWSLIIGTLVMQVSNAALLTLKSNWKPKFFYSIKIFKEMLSFSVWSLIEAISIWLTTWIDAFIIGNLINQYYLGLYKTSMTMVNTIMALVTASTLPVIFSTLSRLQNNNTEFKKMFFKFQRIVSILIFPLGVGIYLYSDLATQLLLGNQWKEASNIIGIWAITSAIIIVFGYSNSEVYRAKGMPKLSFLSQLLHLIFLVPVIVISGHYGFWALVYSRSWARLQGSLVGFIIMKYVIGIPILKTISNVLPTAISAIGMGILGLVLKYINHGIIWEFFSIFLCALIYFILLFLFPNMRTEFLLLVRKVLPNKIVVKYQNRLQRES